MPCSSGPSKDDTGGCQIATSICHYVDASFRRVGTMDEGSQTAGGAATPLLGCAE